jgi:predicted AAA+ superfamily ATPase
MQPIYQKFETLLASTTLDFKRYLHDEIEWNSRMIGIVGPRGAGKTTLILQFIKEHLNIEEQRKRNVGTKCLNCFQN